MPSYNDHSNLDILITGGTLVTLDDNLCVINDAVIGIRDGRFVLIENQSLSSASYVANEKMDASGCLILPGLINTHTHAPMVCFRGMADDLPLMEWLNNNIFPAEAKYVDREMVYHGTILAVTEMLLSGTTTFADGYFFESEVARAAVMAGIRAVVAEGFIDFPQPDDHAIKQHIKQAEGFIRQMSDFSPLVTPALFCHAPYSCSPRTLRCMKDCAESSHLQYFIHVAETSDEVTKINDQGSETPVCYLRNLGVLNESTVAVHCVWVDEKDIEILADKGVNVSHVPESNMKLGCGIAPVHKMLKSGITIGLGTDGGASNNDLDMLREMDTAAKVHKVSTMDPTVLDDITVLLMATRHGAKALGLDRDIGSIEIGKKADLILIDSMQPHLTPIYNPYSHIVYSASGSDVTTVIIDGKIVVRDRKLLTFEIAESIDKVKKIAERIMGF